MKQKYMERLMGKYCKIVMKEPGEDRASVITGVLEDVDYKDGFVLIDSSQGLGCIKIDTIIAIKPSNKRVISKRSIKSEDKAVVGIGTLIVFIAIILVAAVAASIIIQTSEALQQRAYAVSKQTLRQVSSGIDIVDLTGYTNEGKTKIEYLAVSLKPRSGSYDIDLNETLLYIQYDNLTVLKLNWADNDVITGTVNQSGVFHTLNHSNLTSVNFGLIAVRDPDATMPTSFGMSTDDLALIIVNLTAAFPDTVGLNTGEEFVGRLVPEVGSTSSFLVQAPNAFEHRIVSL